jgi:C4-dicarboxylate transporter, DctQ subunit
MKVLNHLEEWFITFLIAAATLIIFVSVGHRYAAGLPIPGVQNWLLSLNFGWAQELCIIMFVWMAKFGAAYGVRTGIHVGVDVLINRMEDRVRGKFIIFGLFAGATFTIIVGTLGLRFIWENGMHYAVFTLLGMNPGDVPQGPTTPDLEWPTWIVYSAVPLGSYLMCFRFLQVMVNFIRFGELPRHDHGHVDGIDEVKLPVNEVSVPVDFDPFELDDDLHPHDLTHKETDEAREKEDRK